MNMTTPKPGASQGWAAAGRTPRIAIIGAGLSGIGAVVKLREAGYTDLTVYEKYDKVGGTWRDNTYPGLSCDIPSHWYSYSFEPNPNWSHRFSYGPEIQAYVEHVARKYDVMPIIQFNTAVSDLTYEAPVWRLKTEQGAEEIFDLVITATGILRNPAVPDFKGLDRFQGDCFHTARWDHSVSLKGKRVGIIGTGSTSAQIVGAIAKDVAHLTVFQRTPHWVVPLGQKTYSAFSKRVLKMFPILQKFLYNYFYWAMERTFSAATIGDKAKQMQITKSCLKNLADNVPDPKLRARLTPDYQAACKRLIFCSDFYPAMSQDNVLLETDGIAEIEARGVRTKTGALHEFDVLIMATGFRVGDFVLPMNVYGEDKLELSALWDGAPRAHRAVAIPSFPNFWMLEGPTGPVGNLSLISITEAQIGYLVQCLDKMKSEKLVAMAPRQEAYDDYNAAMSEAVTHTVWATGGCQSWYIDKTGKPNLYPWAPKRFREEMANVDFSEFRLISELPQQVMPVAGD